MTDADETDGSGPNCEAGLITVSTAQESQCVYKASDVPDDSQYYCAKGSIKGRYCRVVPDDTDDSLITIQPGQRCTQDQINPGSDTLRVHIIDVGQGDAIWIQTPAGKNVLIDGGDGGAFGKTSGGPIISDYLSFHGFPYGSTFDLVILTHPHSDHFGGFNNLFNQNLSASYKLANYLDPMDLDDPQANVPTTYEQWISKMRGIVKNKKNIYMPASARFAAGDQFPDDFFGDGVTATYITSADTYSGDDANAASIIFKLTYAGISFMFAGDAEAAQEKTAIATKLPLDVNFFKVCHHGSSTSSTQAFLNAMWKKVGKSERYALISSGRRTFSGTTIPDPSVVSRLLSMIYTDHLFATSAGDDGKTEVDTYRDDNILVVVKPDGNYYACYNGTN